MFFKMLNKVILLYFFTSSACLSAPWDDWDVNKNIDEMIGNKVHVTVNYSLDQCAISHPLLVNIKNDTRRTIVRVDFDYHVQLKGFSTNLVKQKSYKQKDYPYKTVYYNPGSYSDKIMKPGTEYSFCSVTPKIKQKDKKESYSYDFMITETTDNDGGTVLYRNGKPFWY